MLILLSPAKTLDFELPAGTEMHSELIFTGRAEYLIKKLRKYSPRRLRKLMDISEDLANLNERRFAEWKIPELNVESKQALFAFNGDVYQGLNARSLSSGDLEYAQDHLRILSGLYGILRPLDLILPYRLEMGTPLKITPKKKNLYEYWKPTLTKLLLEHLQSTNSGFVLNLASQEYSKAVNLKKFGVPIIAPAFKEEKGDKFQMISFFAKKARGMMAAFAIQNQIREPEELKNFSHEGYTFNDRLSDTAKNKWVFTRKTT